MIQVMNDRYQPISLLVFQPIFFSVIKLLNYFLLNQSKPIHFGMQTMDEVNAKLNDNQIDLDQLEQEILKLNNDPGNSF